MLKRDYIMRLIREFAEALELLLKKDVSRQREEISRMYDQYVGPAAFYRTAPMGEVMESFARFAPEERAQRMEMLAELYYTESGLTPGPTGWELLSLLPRFELKRIKDKYIAKYLPAEKEENGKA